MSFSLDVQPDGITLGRFSHLGTPHGVASRTGGVSEGPYASLNLGPLSGDDRDRIAENRRRFLAAIGTDGRTLIAPRQVHSAAVSVHRRGDPIGAVRVFDGDGLVTDDPAVALSLLAADCAALLLHDPDRRVVAALHAGWRGTAGNIAAAGVRRMVEEFDCDPRAIRAGIGPAIGRCCYEVGIDVAEQVAAAAPPVVCVYETRGGGKAHLDIVAANRAQLEAAGLLPDHIDAAGICTACRTDFFFSHRREGEPTGRFGAAIMVG